MSKNRFQAIVEGDNGEWGAFILEGDYDSGYGRVIEGQIIHVMPQGDVDAVDLISSHSERAQAMDRHYGRRQS